MCLVGCYPIYSRSVFVIHDIDLAGERRSRESEAFTIRLEAAGIRIRVGMDVVVHGITSLWNAYGVVSSIKRYA